MTLHHSARVLVPLASLPFLLGACQANSSSASPVVRDSAGVRLVEYRVPADSTASLTVSPMDLPTSEFGDITSVALLEGPRLFVADHLNKVVVVLDARTNTVRPFGRAGSGPGEFTTVTRIVEWGRDSVAVFDWGARRVSFFSTAGDFGRQLELSGIMPDVPGVPMLQGQLRDSILVFELETRFNPERQQPIHTGSVSIYGVAPSPAPDVRSMLTRAGSDWYVEHRGGGYRVRAVPYSPRLLVCAAGARLYVAHGDAEITGFGADSEPEIVIRELGAGRSPVGREAVAKYWEDRVAGMPEPLRDAERRYADIIRPATSFPAYDRLLCDPDRNVWVRLHADVGAENTLWMAYDGDGVRVGSVTLPRRLDLVALRGEFVAAIETDDADVEIPRLLRIRPD